MIWMRESGWKGYYSYERMSINKFDDFMDGKTPYSIAQEVLRGYRYNPNHNASDEPFDIYSRWFSIDGQGVIFSIDDSLVGKYDSEFGNRSGV